MKQAINNVEDLRQVIRTTIQSLEFVPDTELQEQYTDDENTSITLLPKTHSSTIGIVIQMDQGRHFVN